MSCCELGVLGGWVGGVRTHGVGGGGGGGQVALYFVCLEVGGWVGGWMGGWVWVRRWVGGWDVRVGRFRGGAWSPRVRWQGSGRGCRFCQSPS